MRCNVELVLKFLKKRNAKGDKAVVQGCANNKNCVTPSTKKPQSFRETHTYVEHMRKVHKMKLTTFFCWPTDVEEDDDDDDEDVFHASGL